jgi:hypothetical protein
MRKRHDVYGDAFRFPAGETFHQDNAGGLWIKNSSGLIVKTINRYEAETKFVWEVESNELIGVVLPDGQPYKKRNEVWYRVAESGTLEETDKTFRVLADGTLRVCYESAHGMRFAQDIRLDGSVVMLDERCRQVGLRVQLEVQRERLYKTLDNLRKVRLITCDQRQGLCDAYHAVTRRVALEELTEAQAAQTVFHITRLLENGGSSAFGAQVSFMLAHELMFFSALPDEAEDSDGLSVFIGHLFRHMPEHAAMVVADMSIFKKYITSTGLTVHYVEELMHPITRREKEWQCAAAEQKRFMESNRFLRVVLVNIIDRSRMARRSYKENLTALADSKRAMSTREFGKVFTRELSELFEHVTGASGASLDFTAKKEAEPLERAFAFAAGNNASEVA